MRAETSFGRLATPSMAVVGGLSMSTLLTLFVVPSAYVVFNRGGERLKSWVTGEPRRREVGMEPGTAAAGD